MNKNLLFFYGTDCSYCDGMVDIVDKLISEGFNILKLDVSKKENDDLMISLDKGECACGGIPFFLNQETKKIICGEASYKQVKNWAEGK